MRERFLVLALTCSLVGLLNGSMASASTPKGTMRTVIAGAWQATPTAFLTGGSPQNCGFTYQAVATLHGAFNGVWHETAMTAYCGVDRLPSSLPFRGAGSGTFDGVYFADGSRGSFTWKGVWTGEALSGQLIGDFDITSSSGDPTWRCSTLHLKFDGLLVNAVTGFGGYRGTWNHGCKS